MLYALGEDAPQLEDESVWVATSADVMGKVRLAAGVSVWFQCVMRGDNEQMVIGEDSNIQDGSICHSDYGAPLTVGREVTVGHGVTLHGCTIEDGCLIGMGATILNKAVIREGSIVGAGALVTEGKSFEPGMLIVGSPARAVRALTDEEKAFIRLSAKHYRENATKFRSQLKPVGA